MFEIMGFCMRCSKIRKKQGCGGELIGGDPDLKYSLLFKYRCVKIHSTITGDQRCYPAAVAVHANKGRGFCFRRLTAGQV
jgi:hypothetical protein